MHAIILKPNRERSILRKHPWIFSGAILNVEGDPKIGETVVVKDSLNNFLGKAAYSPNSSIRARIWTFDANQKIDKEYFENKLRVAILLRKEFQIFSSSNDSFRLFHGESDGLPGLIIDQYGKTLVLQSLSAGIEHWRELIIETLSEVTHCTTIYERSDAAVRDLEGLPKQTGTIYGLEPQGFIQISENGLKFLVDIKNGQKTGFFLDQQKNRKKLQWYSNEKDILNCFSYTGGFTLNALKGGCRTVTAIESSQEAIAIAKKNVNLNNFDEEKVHWVCGDVFKELRKMRDADKKYDTIVLDPPKFAPTVAQKQSASRGYKDINLLAFKLLKPKGTLFTFSCSGGINGSLFQKIVADAALDAGVNAKIVERLSQNYDHPIALNFPEGEYLKGLICKI